MNIGSALLQVALLEDGPNQDPGLQGGDILLQESDQGQNHQLHELNIPVDVSQGHDLLNLTSNEFC